jgi:hypothetical protein
VSWEAVLGYWTGISILVPEIAPALLWRTALVIHTCDAIMCRLFAHNNGYSKRFWTIVGFVFGIWALALLIVLPKRVNPQR